MRESVAVVCHDQGAISVSDKSRSPRPQELGLLKEKQKSELRADDISRRYNEVERERDSFRSG